MQIKIFDALKPWMARFDSMSLQQRLGLVASTAAVVYFVLSIALVGQGKARSNAVKQRIEAQKAELETVRKDIRELSAALERDPNVERQAQLDGMKRTIVETDALLAQLDAAAPQAAGAVLRELLAATPGLELVSLRTVPATLVFQSKAAPVAPASPAAAPANPGPTAATPAPAAKDPAPPRPLRSIYRNGIEISIKGNYLALLPYLEKLQKYPGRLHWTEASLNVEGYPLAVLKLRVYTLSGQATPRLG
jgi:MSHA biogenesis protein MshJ